MHHSNGKKSVIGILITQQNKRFLIN